MRVLVCGGRRYTDKQRVYDTLDTVHAQRKITVIVEGGAKGADALGALWARTHSVRLETYAISQREWDELGNAAGPRRNQRMLDEGRPDVVIAFPGRSGTRDMILRARRQKFRVVIITE